MGDKLKSTNSTESPNQTPSKLSTASTASNERFIDSDTISASNSKNEADFAITTLLRFKKEQKEKNDFAVGILNLTQSTQKQDVTDPNCQSNLFKMTGMTLNIPQPTADLFPFKTAFDFPESLRLNEVVLEREGYTTHVSNPSTTTLTPASSRVNAIESTTPSTPSIDTSPAVVSKLSVSSSLSSTTSTPTTFRPLKINFKFSPEPHNKVEEVKPTYAEATKKAFSSLNQLNMKTNEKNIEVSEQLIEEWSKILDQHDQKRI